MRVISAIIYAIISFFAKWINKKKTKSYEGTIEIDNDITRDELIEHYDRVSEGADSEDELGADTGKPE